MPSSFLDGMNPLPLVLSSFGSQSSCCLADKGVPLHLSLSPSWLTHPLELDSFSSFSDPAPSGMVDVPDSGLCSSLLLILPVLGSLVVLTGGNLTTDYSHREDREEGRYTGGLAKPPFFSYECKFKAKQKIYLCTKGQMRISPFFHALNLSRFFRKWAFSGHSPRKRPHRKPVGRISRHRRYNYTPENRAERNILTS